MRGRGGEKVQSEILPCHCSVSQHKICVLERKLYVLVNLSPTFSGPAATKFCIPFFKYLSGTQLRSSQLSFLLKLPSQHNWSFSSVEGNNLTLNLNWVIK